VVPMEIWRQGRQVLAPRDDDRAVHLERERVVERLDRVPDLGRALRRYPSVAC